MDETVNYTNNYIGHIVPYYPPNGTELTNAPIGVRLKTTFGMIVAGVIIGGIIAAIGQGLEWSWLFYTGIGIGVVIFGAGMFTVFTQRIGKCPYCHQEVGRGSEMNLSSKDENSQVECHVCCSWLISHENKLRAYTIHDVKPDTEFKCKVMDQSIWQHECLVCGALPTRFIELKNTNLNATSLLIGRVSVSWGTLRNAPYCNFHDDAVKLKVENKEMFLKFNDFHTMKRYQHVNYHKLMTGQRL